MRFVPGIADSVEGAGEECVDCTSHAAITVNLASSFHGLASSADPVDRQSGLYWVPWIESAMSKHLSLHCEDWLPRRNYGDFREGVAGELLFTYGRQSSS